ncbi:MAG: hypothetical protein GVY10_04785 [Verrucomicrobia bacterium]|jgi:hypothetical protein|nr:hypothetical protein [Verrucomicrobiota bacterium]
MNKCFSLCAGLLFGSSLLIAAPPPVFGPTEDHGNGWKKSDWFGFYNDLHYPWIYHSQHTWEYVAPADDWLWLWDSSIGDWCLTHGGLYPYMYLHQANHWMWYYQGTGTPRWFWGMNEACWYNEMGGALVNAKIRGGFDRMMAMVDPQDLDTEELMGQAMGIALLALIGDPATSTCPVITREPAELDLENPPPRLEAGVDFGNGCQPEGSELLIAGNFGFLLQNLFIGESSMNADFSMEAEALSIDGLQIMDGSISGGLSVTSMEPLNLTANVQMNNFALLEERVSGSIELTMTGLDTEGMTAGNINLAINDLGTADTRFSGSVAMVVENENNLSVVLDLTGTEGEIDLDLALVTDSEAEILEISTTEKGSVTGVTVELDQVLIDPSVCANMPVSGSIDFWYDGEHYRMIFDGACGYQMIVM